MHRAVHMFWQALLESQHRGSLPAIANAVQQTATGQGCCPNGQCLLQKEGAGHALAAQKLPDACIPQLVVRHALTNSGLCTTSFSTDCQGGPRQHSMFSHLLTQRNPCQGTGRPEDDSSSSDG